MSEKLPARSVILPIAIVEFRPPLERPARRQIIFPARQPVLEAGAVSVNMPVHGTQADENACLSPRMPAWSKGGFFRLGRYFPEER